MKKNIFENLIKNENSFTAGFANLLSISEALREKFANYLNEKFEADTFTADFFLNPYTQKNLEEGQPDVLVENNKHILLIEVKTELKTELQETQKDAYKGIFKKFKKKEKFMLFIVPKLYKHLDEIPHKKQGINIKTIYWEDIIEECLHTNSENEFEQRVISDFTQLLKIKLNFIEIFFTKTDLKMKENSNAVNLSLKFVALFEKLKTWEKDEYETNETWVDIEDNSMKIWFRGDSEVPVVGFIVTHQEQAECIEDHFEIQTFWKKISKDICSKYGITKVSEIDGEWSYKIEKGLVKPDEDFGKKMVDMIAEILEHQQK